MSNFTLATCFLLWLLGPRRFLAHALTNQTCTSSPCDLQCVDQGICVQSCNVLPCKMSCNSGQACRQTCSQTQGGCSKMSCKSNTVCALSCPNGNCKEMSCNSAKSCHMSCKSNCDMTCTKPCSTTCSGSGCNVRCKTKDCSSTCDQGSCVVEFAERSSGSLYCFGGNCTVICPWNAVCKIPVCFGAPCKTIHRNATSSGQQLFVHHQNIQLLLLLETIFICFMFKSVSTLTC